MMLTRHGVGEPEYPDDMPIWHLNQQEADLLHSSTDGSNEAITAIQEDLVEGQTNGRRAEPNSQTRHNFWIRWICGWPKLMFGVTLAGQLTFVIVTVVLLSTGYPIFPTAFNDMPMENIKSLEYRRFLAWSNINNEAQPVYTFMPSRKKRHISSTVQNLNIHKNQDPPISTRRKRETSAAVQKIRMDEEFQIFYELPAGQNILEQKYLERIRRFEDIISTALVHPFGNSDIRLAEYHHSMLDAFNENLTEVISYPTLDRYVGKSVTYNHTAGTAASNLVRSTFYVTYWGDWEWDDTMTYFLETMRPKFLDAVDAVFEDITAYVWNFPMYGEAIKRQVFTDMYLFCGSVVFIFSFILFQTASLWITTWGTFSIVVSFLGANIIYDCVIGYKFFGLFNVLALFIVLGLGADDIFIFLDTWKNLAGRGLSMEERMAQTYKKAVVAMFSTSLTTMVAFMVNAFAPLLPIRTFGLFAGLTVMVNYASVVVFFPTVVAVHHKHFEKPCCSRRRNSTVGDGVTSCTRLHDRAAQFFGQQYYRFVTHKWIRWVIVLGFVALVTGMAMSLSKLRVDEKPAVQLFISTNKFEKARNLKEQGFKQNLNDIPVQVLMLWGLKPRDMSSCDPRYYKPFYPCPGVGRYDTKFNLEKAENQLAMKRFCQALKVARTTNPSLMIDTATCLIETFESTIHELANITLPITNSKLKKLEPLLASVLGVKIDRNLATPFSTLLYLWSQRAKIPENMFGFTKLHRGDGPVGKMDGVPFYNMRLQYMVGADVKTSMTVFDFGIDSGLKLLDSYESFMKQQSATMPFGLSQGFQASYFWYRLRDRLQIVQQGALGVAVSLTLAFVLILLATQNIILSLLAIVSLSSAVTCVLGIMPIAGWSLGILEGLNMAFVAGLSVDYILHIVHAYRISNHHTRHARTQDSLHAVGVSIVSGAVTTLGSSAFIMFSQIEFFLEFGVFIFCTVGFSVLHAMLLFPALLSICGPSHNQGYVLFFCKNRKRNGETGEENNIDYIQADDF